MNEIKLRLSYERSNFRKAVKVNWKSFIELKCSMNEIDLRLSYERSYFRKAVKVNRKSFIE